MLTMQEHWIDHYLELQISVKTRLHLSIIFLQNVSINMKFQGLAQLLSFFLRGGVYQKHYLFMAKCKSFGASE